MIECKLFYLSSEKEPYRLPKCVIINKLGVTYNVINYEASSIIIVTYTYTGYRGRDHMVGSLN